MATDENDNPSLLLNDRKGGFKAGLLYATDVILLGNINENNLYGIPQFFKALPSTTSNVPPIASINNVGNEDVALLNNPLIANLRIKTDTATIGDGDTGEPIVTGMDWGNKDDAEKLRPQYSKGLFVDLSCTYVKTRAKTCINVERLSEFGVTLDIAHRIQYMRNGELTEGEFKTDGFISKYELEDLENRAMFATMNHIGFLPQPAQDKIDPLYKTQIHDDN